MVATLRDSSSAMAPRLANRLFGEKTYAFQEPFLEELQASGASVEPLDFAGAPSSVR